MAMLRKGTAMAAAGGGKPRGFALVCAGAVIGLAVVATACSSSNTSGATKTDNGMTNAGSGTGNTGSGVADSITAARAAITKAGKPAKWTAPGPPLDASKAKGDTVVYLANGQTPFTQPIAKAMKEAGSKAGLNVIIDFVTKGSISDADTAIGNAISSHANAIVISSFNSSALSAPLAHAASLGIKNIQLGEHGPGPLTKEDQTAGVVGNVASCFECAGTLMADFVAADSQGKAHALYIGVPDIGVAVAETKTFTTEFHKVCSSCSLKLSQIPFASEASQMPGAVSAALVADPDLDYIIPTFDTAYPIASAAIKAGGRADKVKIVGTDASQPELQIMKSGTKPILAFDCGFNQAQIGWTAIDAALRGILGLPQDNGAAMPAQCFTPDSVKGFDLTSSSNAWFGSSGYEDGFLKLWGVTK